jgi:hypothetical protein
VLNGFVHFLLNGGSVEQLKAMLAGSREFFNDVDHGLRGQRTRCRAGRPIRPSNGPQAKTRLCKEDHGRYNSA